MNRPDPPDDDGLQQYLLRRRFARECALQFLYQLDRGGFPEWCGETFERFWQQITNLEGCPPEQVAAQARDFAERLVRGVCEHRDTLDRKITDSARNWTLDRMDVVDRNILRLAVFELVCCADIPDVATINEAVELAKEFGHAESGSFVNGILDQLRRQCLSGCVDDPTSSFEPAGNGESR